MGAANSEIAVKSFFHEKINFICSNHRVSFFLLHRYECFENKNKKLDKKKRKNKGMTSAISSLVGVWKICHLHLGCSLWKIRVVHFSVKHSYLYNKYIYLYFNECIVFSFIVSLILCSVIVELKHRTTGSLMSIHAMTLMYFRCTLYIWT